MNNICKCDFHTHILPFVDDGANNIDMSISLLKMETEQGVKQLCFTPHFYENDSVDEFIKKRDASFKALNEEMQKHEFKDIPKFYLGAEVRLSYTTPEIADLGKLCLSGTKLLLLEPPYSYWGDWLTDVVYRISAKNSLTPVIAHADRYLDNKHCAKILNKLADMDVLMQFNSYNLTNSKTRSLLRKIIRRGNVPLIGSDAHSTDFRTVTMNKTQSLGCKLLLDKDLIYKVNCLCEKLLDDLTKNEL